MATTSKKTTAPKTPSKTLERQQKILEENRLLKGLPDLPPKLVGQKRIIVMGAISGMETFTTDQSKHTILMSMSRFLDDVSGLFDDPAGFQKWLDDMSVEDSLKAPLALAERLQRMLGESTPSAV